MFDQHHLEELKVGLSLYNQEKFWECHECLEDVWNDHSHSPLKFISWAIIQIATSLYHVRNKNLKGAQGMLSKAKEKLQKCEALKIECDFLNQSLHWQEYKQLVFAIKAEDNLESFNNLYKFRFTGIK